MLLVACGPKPTPAHPDRGSASAPPDAPVAEIPPSDGDCDALFAHAVALAAADQPAATDEDQTRARADIKVQYAARCHAMAHADYLCALSAPTLAAFGDCYETRSSSTSNSSVAPGGITPAAPRSP